MDDDGKKFDTKVRRRGTIENVAQTPEYQWFCDVALTNGTLTQAELFRDMVRVYREKPRTLPNEPLIFPV